MYKEVPPNGRDNIETKARFRDLEQGMMEVAKDLCELDRLGRRAEKTENAIARILTRQIDILERLSTLEKAVFPNLKKGLKDAERVIGKYVDSIPDDPLDAIDVAKRKKLRRRR